MRRSPRSTGSPEAGTIRAWSRRSARPARAVCGPSRTEERHSMPCSAPILVVDDDPEIRDAICMVLGAEGYPTNSAGDGEEAIERLHDDRPCLILLDLMMPRMNG